MMTSGRGIKCIAPSKAAGLIAGGELVCVDTRSGWLKSERPVGDFVLQLEFKLPPKAAIVIFIRTPRRWSPSSDGGYGDSDYWTGRKPLKRS